MHYIIGTRLSFTKTPPRIGSTSTSMTSQHKPTEFAYNKIYTLYNIKKTELDEFVYSFRDSEGNIIQQLFKTIKQADNWIANFRKEHVPDYNAVYARNTS